MCSVSALTGRQVRSAADADAEADPAAGVEFEQVQFTAGTVVFEPHTPAGHLFFVEQGQVRIYQVGRNDTRLLRILGPGEWFGVAALAGQASYQKRAVVAGTTTTILRRIPAERLVRHLAERPSEATVTLVRQLASKLLEAQEDAARLAFDDCHSRLVKALVRFSASAAASSHADGQQVVLRITHQQLAQAVGAARETVSLALTELRQQNLLRTGRNQLIFNPETLQRWFESRGAGDNSASRRGDMMIDHSDDNQTAPGSPVAQAAVA
jgi:CRP/FNR family transcriptional regulator